MNNSNVILTEAQRNSEDIVGRRAVWATHHARSAATGARAEGGTLPTAAYQQFDDLNQKLKYVYHTIKVSGQAIALTRNDTGAFRRALDVEMKGAESDLKNDLARQIFGRGTVQTGSLTTFRTGALATTPVNTDVSVIQLSTTTTGQQTATTAAEMRYFFVNMVIDVITTLTGAAVTNGTGRTITAIDATNKTITVSGASNISTVAGDQVVRAGSYDNEFPGLRVLVNDNAGDKIDGTNVVTVHALSSTTVPAWAAVKVGSSSTPISEDLLEQAFDKVLTNGDGNQPKLLVGSFDQRRALANKLQAQKRYDGRDVTLTSGWKGLNVARGTYVAERYCPDNDIFLLNTSELSWFVGLDLTWDEVDGKVMFKSATTDDYEARMKAYVCLAATNRNSHCRIAVQSV